MEPLREHDAPGVSLLDLPEEILERILQLAGLSDAWPARRTCRRVRDAVDRASSSGRLAPAHELRAAADDPAVLEALAKLIRAGRVRAESLSITLGRPRASAPSAAATGNAKGGRGAGAASQLFKAAAAVLEAWAPAAGAAQPAAGEATLVVREDLFEDGAFLDALRGAPPALGRLSGLRLPVGLRVVSPEANAIVELLPRLRRLSFEFGSWFAKAARRAPERSDLFNALDVVVRALSRLPLEELAVDGARGGVGVEGAQLRALANGRAGRSLRSLDFGRTLSLDRVAAGGLFSLPASSASPPSSPSGAIPPDPEACTSALYGVLLHGALREASLSIRVPPTGFDFVRDLQMALESRPTPLSDLSLHLEIFAVRTRGALVPLLEVAGPALRSFDLSSEEPPAPGELAALAACARLERARLSHPLPEGAGACAPAGYLALAPLAHRLEVRLGAASTSTSGGGGGGAPGRPGALEALRRLLPGARVELDSP
eukprot:tig00020557_g11128.t1